MRTLEAKLNHYVKLLIERYPVLEIIKEEVVNAYLVLEESYTYGGKLMIAGNGGSAADADHIAGELMKGFKKHRKISDEFAKSLKGVDIKKGEELAEKLQGALPTIALHNHIAFSTAYSNDVAGHLCFAQQVNAYGKAKDAFLGISTSGNSKNIIYAAITAKAKDIKVIALTGKDGGTLKEISDVSIVVPESETYIIQELHLPIYHCLCLMLEEKFFQ